MYCISVCLMGKADWVIFWPRNGVGESESLARNGARDLILARNRVRVFWH